MSDHTPLTSIGVACFARPAAGSGKLQTHVWSCGLPIGRAGEHHRVSAHVRDEP